MNKIFGLIFLLIFILPTVGYSKGYNLEEYLALVKKHNKDIQLSKQELAAAATQEKEARALAFPSVSANAGYIRNLNDNFLYIDLGGDEGISKIKTNRNNEFSMNLTVSQTLFSGTVFNAIKAAKQYNVYVDHLYDASISEILTYAKKAYYQTLLLRHVWEVTTKSETNALENYNNMQSAYKNGLISEFALLQAEVRYRDAVPVTLEAKRNLDIALIGLKNISGISPTEDLQLTSALINYPELPNSVPFEEILRNRPDYKAMLWEEKLRSTNVKVEKSSYFPTLAGFFTYAYNAQSDRFRLDEENNNYLVGLNLSVPLFTGGATTAKVRRAKVDLHKSRIAIAKQRDKIWQEYKNIQLRINETYMRIEAARTTFTTAQKAFSIAESSVSSGLITQLELKDARLARDQSEIYYYSAIYEYFDACFEQRKIYGITENLNDNE